VAHQPLVDSTLQSPAPTALPTESPVVAHALNSAGYKWRVQLYDSPCPFACSDIQVDAGGIKDAKVPRCCPGFRIETSHRGPKDSSIRSTVGATHVKLKLIFGSDIIPVMIDCRAASGIRDIVCFKKRIQVSLAKINAGL